MPDNDAIGVHLENLAEEGGAFSLSRHGKTWTATGTRKGARKELSATADTALGAVADLLAQIRGVEAPVEEEATAEAPASTVDIATAATPDDED